MLPVVPMRLCEAAQPFDSPDHLYEVKSDGFRALADVQSSATKLISRRHHTYHSFHPLATHIRAHLQGESALLDGEIVCLDNDGRPQFYDLLRRRGVPRFYAFDVLVLEGRDLRQLPLIERKLILRSLIPPDSPFLLYSAHIEKEGVALFRQANDGDLSALVPSGDFALIDPAAKLLP